MEDHHLLVVGEAVLEQRLQLMKMITGPGQSKAGVGCASSFASLPGIGCYTDP
jgi:hypothetical protein